MKSSLLLDTAHTLTGTVITSTANSVTIKIQLNGVEVTQAESNGKFSFRFSQTVPLDRQWVVVSAVGYQTQRHLLAHLVLRQPVQLLLLPEKAPDYLLQGRMGGVVAYHRKWYSPKGLFYQSRDFFRYTVPGFFSGN